MSEAYDVIVVGAGAMGTATARVLAERGRATLLLERFELGHSRGSSGGSTRIFRLTHQDPEDVRMARLALDAWRELEDRAGEPLLVTTGGIDLGPGVPAIAESVAAAGVEARVTSAAEVVERWPALRLGRDEVLVQEDAGVIAAERTVRAQARLAVRAGATILPNRPVEAISADGFGVEVRTAGEVVRATIAVVTAGAWMSKLLRPAGLELPLTPTLEQVTHFELDQPAPMPTIVDRTASGPWRSAYVVPHPDEPGAFKVGLRHADPPTDPADRPFEPDPARVEATTRYAAERLDSPRPTGASETCLVTNTPDDAFIFDRRGPLVVGSACSGHGFTFTPLVGRILADLATAQPAPMPIERFLMSRFGRAA